LVIGAVIVAIPATLILRARSVPMIHDITTDTDEPPAFEAVLSARGPGANSAEYGGPAIAAQQHQAYPDLRSVVLRDAPASAFDRVLKAARQLGWAIVASDPGRGRVEATDTTFWFGFKDDVVIRIRAEGTGSRIDMRSLSRVGRSDVGTNAGRIRRFFDILQRP
jgi:uncharacterized protein (DUF1499 family)